LSDTQSQETLKVLAELMPLSNVHQAGGGGGRSLRRRPGGTLNDWAFCAKRRREMSYKEAVREKIESSTARQQERGALWEEITSAYEKSGAQAVESTLTKKIGHLAVESRHVLEKLERML